MKCQNTIEIPMVSHFHYLFPWPISGADRPGDIPKKAPTDGLVHLAVAVAVGFIDHLLQLLGGWNGNVVGSPTWLVVDQLSESQLG